MVSSANSARLLGPATSKSSSRYSVGVDQGLIRKPRTTKADIGLPPFMFLCKISGIILRSPREVARSTHSEYGVVLESV